MQRDKMEIMAVPCGYLNVVDACVVVGSIRLLRPVRGPSEHVLTLQMEVQSRTGVVMSRHIAHVSIYVGAYHF